MTMYRYIALMWTPTDREAARAAKFVAATLPEVSPHQWSLAWQVAGLAIYHSGEQKGRMQTYRLYGQRGAVLGRLFRNDYTSVVEDLDQCESHKCVETKGQHLIDNYWGRYVALLNDPETGTRYVVRDPSGAFPCFHTPFRGVTIYFSDMQDAANFDFLPFTVNWESLKAEIMLPHFQKMITGLNEVSEVRPAERVEITPFERRSRFVWNPTEISQTDVVNDSEEAAELLRTTVMGAIGALAGCYDRILHNIGGLDSSIATACLEAASKRPKITYTTFFTESPLGDERYYSRQVATKFGSQIMEWELDYRKADIRKIFACNKSAHPPHYSDITNLSGERLSLTKELEAQAVFTGNGGDSVFFHVPMNIGVLDYARRCGVFQKDIVKILMEASRYGSKSIFATLHEMLRERIACPSCYSYIHNIVHSNVEKTFVNRELVGDGGYERYLHPLLIPRDNDIKGKHLHILLTAFCQLEYYERWDSEYCAEPIHVYLVQPVIEACLRIPIWVLTYGGVDRGLARKAFQNDLPRDIVRRYSKGTPQAYYQDLYKHNLDFIKEVLLGGVLAREKVLLRDKLEAGLNKEDVFLQAPLYQLFVYLCMEAWLRDWTG